MTRLALSYAAGFAVVLLLADFGVLRPCAEFVNAHPPADKVVHFLMYGCLALLVNAALAAQLHWSLARAVVAGSIFALIAATIEEYSNAFMTSRSWSLGDLAANYLGILFAGILPLLGSQESAKKGSGTICAKHPSGRSGKRFLTPFSFPAKMPSQPVKSSRSPTANDAFRHR
jgi:VanZ family protein